MPAESRSVVVRLSFEAARAVAEAKAAGRSIEGSFDSVDGKIKATDRSMVDLEVSTRGVGVSMDDTSGKAQRLGKEIDTVSGRLGLLVEAGLLLAPALSPIGAAGTAGLVALSTQAGFAVGALGTLLLSVQGVGDALGAANEAAFLPTSANLAAARLEMTRLGPDARALVDDLIGVRDIGIDLRDRAAAGVVPGIQTALDAVIERAPLARRLIGTFADATGDVIGRAGQSLAGDRYRDFFQFLNRDAEANISGVASVLGNLASAATEVFEAFGPLNLDILDGLVDFTGDIDEAAGRLEGSDGFRKFADYVRETGPQVVDTAGAIGGALVDIGTAIAPLGGPVLRVIEGFADGLGAIADSDLGTPIFAGTAALVGYQRALILTESLQKRVLGGSAATAGGGIVGRTRNLASGLRPADIGKAGALLAGVTIAATGAADGIGLTNTAAGALAGTLLGPVGAAAGAAVGFTLDLAHANDTLRDSIDAANDASRDATLQELEATRSRLSKDLDKRGTSPSSVIGNLFGDSLDKDRADAEDAIAGIDARIAALQGNAGGIGDLLGAPFDLAGDAIDRATASVEEYTRAVQLSLGILSDEASFDAYKAAIKGAREALEDNGKTLTANTAAGRENRASLRDLAATALEYSDTISNPKARTDFLAGSRKSYVDAAVGFGMTKDAARAAADELGLLGRVKATPIVDPDVSSADRKFGRTASQLAGLDAASASPKVDLKSGSFDAAIGGVKGALGGVDRTDATPKVTAQTGGSIAAVDAVRRAINAVTSKTVTLTVLRRTIGRAATGAVQGAVPGSADGGSVPKDGGVYGDRYLYMLAPGEEVISNRRGQADQFRADRAAGRIPGYADGGTTGRRDRPSRGRDVLLDGDDPLVQAGNRSGRALVDFLKDFERDAKKGLRRLEKSSDAASAAVDANKESVDRETAARDEMQRQFDSIVSNIGGLFRSDLFPENTSSNAFDAAATSNDPIAVAQKDIADAEEYQRRYAELRVRGLSGPGLDLAAERGVAGLERVGAYSDADLATYGAVTRRREEVATSTGTLVANAQVGQDLALTRDATTAAVARLDQANAELRNVTAAIRDQERTVDRAGKAQEAATDRLADNTAKGARAKRKRKG